MNTYQQVHTDVQTAISEGQTIVSNAQQTAVDTYAAAQAAAQNYISGDD